MYSVIVAVITFDPMPEMMLQVWSMEKDHRDTQWKMYLQWK